MDGLLAFAVLVAVLVLFRRRIARRLNWRALVGLGFGAVVGVVVARLLLVALCALLTVVVLLAPVFALGVVIYTSVRTGRPVQGILERAFPRRPRREGD